MKKILIINANYYNEITNKLVISAKRYLKKNKFIVRKLDVPGVFEIPIAIKKNINKYDAFVALGCVIKGKTPHFDFICKTTFASIMQLSINFNKPIGNGIITALNKKQAHERCGIGLNKKPNKGFEASRAIISILKNVPTKI